MGAGEGSAEGTNKAGYAAQPVAHDQAGALHYESKLFEIDAFNSSTKTSFPQAPE